MIEGLKEISTKIDRILEVQELILDKLSQGIILSSEEVKKESTPKKMTKKEERDLRVKEIISDLEIKFRYGRVLQRQFNLVQEPSVGRIRNYLNTKDSSAFDGLKRNNT